MKSFQLDPRLASDCINMHETSEYILLLMDNALVPWLILVPKVRVTELYELSESQQQLTHRLINQLSLFLKQQYPLDKLNIAAIGNMVSQLHIHIVGRKENDYCWPGVVWGAEGKSAYSKEASLQLKQKLQILLKHE